jgi:hypothetical protein
MQQAALLGDAGRFGAGRDVQFRQNVIDVLLHGADPAVKYCARHRLTQLRHAQISPKITDAPARLSPPRHVRIFGRKTLDAFRQYELKSRSCIFTIHCCWLAATRSSSSQINDIKAERPGNP